MNEIGRREFLRISALAAAGIAVVACAKKEQPQATATPKSAETKATATPAPETKPAAKEAPVLADQVAAGKLPALNERLPAQPFVVGPGVLVASEDLDWEVGTYDGGILRAVTTNPTWTYPCQHALENVLSCPKHRTGPLSGSIVEGFSVNANVTEFTFAMRKGLKWSDGEPVTTDDIRFAWEDRQLNEQVTPVLSSAYKAGSKPAGEPMKVEFLDEFNFKITFAQPTGHFLKTLGMGNLWDPYNQFIMPKHYLKQFHPTYTSAADLKPLLDEGGWSAEEWHLLFVAKGGTWWGGGCEHEAEGLPVLRGWNVLESPEELVLMERNPYYFKVDTEGKQLPYVTRIEGKVVAKPENIPAAIIAGEINFCREILKHTDIALYKEHEGTAYKVNLDMVYHNAPVALMLNYNNTTPGWQEIVLKKEFRQAINAAINFQQILDAIYLGLGKTCPWYPAGGDPDKANKLLDEIGLDKRDADGFRIGPDGKAFDFFMEVRTDPLYGQPAELIASHLESVGLKVTLKSLESALWNQRRDANELFASIDWLDDCNWPFIMYDYMPDQRIGWGRKWADWMRTDGQEGQEPPDWIKELYEIDTEINAINPNDEEAKALLQRFTDWQMENIPLFPLTRDVADPCIVPPNLGNVPTSGRSSAMMFSEEQVFFKQA